jgi:hypothetical protein
MEEWGGDLTNVQKFTYTWINKESYSTAMEVSSVGHPNTVFNLFFNVQKSDWWGGGGRSKASAFT